LKGSTRGGESDEDLDGFSSDFENEQRGYKCYNAMGVSQLTDCIIGKTDMSKVDGNGKNEPRKKPSSLFGERTFNQVCRET